MSKGKRLGAMLLALLAAGTLAGAENANEVFGLENGAWTHSAKVIPSEKNGVRELAWTGTSLIFAPENGTYSLENAGFFTFLIRVPEAMQKQKFRLTFVCQDGTRKQYKLTMPDHAGCQRYRIPTVIKWAEKEGRAPILKEILLEADNPDFQAFLRDVRMVSGVIDHDFPDDRIPPVTNGCFFPENTLASTKAEVLSDPEFASKMQEIERLRRSKLKTILKKQREKFDETDLAYFSKLRPDGSFEGLSYVDVEKLNRERKLQHTVNETYISEHSHVISRLLRLWRNGRVPRTPENRAKLLRLMNRILSAECNRKGQSGRYVVCSFMLPQTAVQAYGIFFDEMEAVENGSCHDPELIRLNRLLKEAASWCYMEPAARSTAPCLTVNSFRFSAAWTGAANLTSETSIPSRRGRSAPTASSIFFSTNGEETEPVTARCLFVAARTFSEPSETVKSASSAEVRNDSSSEKPNIWTTPHPSRPNTSSPSSTRSANAIRRCPSTASTSVSRRKWHSSQ